MSELKKYRKKQLQQMIPWEPNIPMELVSISEADKANGSPKQGDMIAINSYDATDMWLIASEFFNTNYEEVNTRPNLKAELVEAIENASYIESYTSLRLLTVEDAIEAINTIMGDSHG